MDDTVRVSSPPSVQTRITKLKRSCAGKKGSITKRVTQLSRLVSEGGSRTKIRYLMTALLEVHKATKSVFEELTSVDENTDNEWLETVNMCVDTCVAEIEEYLEARKDEAESSSISITESWIRKHHHQSAVVGVSGAITELSEDFGDISISQFGRDNAPQVELSGIP